MEESGHPPPRQSGLVTDLGGGAPPTHATQGQGAEPGRPRIDDLAGRPLKKHKPSGALPATGTDPAAAAAPVAAAGMTCVRARMPRGCSWRAVALCDCAWSWIWVLGVGVGDAGGPRKPHAPAFLFANCAAWLQVRP